MSQTSDVFVLVLPHITAGTENDRDNLEVMPPFRESFKTPPSSLWMDLQIYSIWHESFFMAEVPSDEGHIIIFFVVIIIKSFLWGFFFKPWIVSCKSITRFPRNEQLVFYLETIALEVTFVIQDAPQHYTHNRIERSAEIEQAWSLFLLIISVSYLFQGDVFAYSSFCQHIWPEQFKVISDQSVFSENCVLIIFMRLCCL